MHLLKQLLQARLTFKKDQSFLERFLISLMVFNLKKVKFIRQNIVPFEFSIIKAKLGDNFENSLLNSKDNFLINSFTDHVTTVSRYSFTFNNQTSKTSNKQRYFTYAKFDVESGGNIFKGDLQLN